MTTLSTAPRRTTRPFELSLEILVGAEGPVLDVEPISDADLSDCLGELWMEGFLRRGRPDVARESIPVRLLPAKKGGATTTGLAPGTVSCDGFILETDGGDGSPVRRAFIPESMKLPAMRAAARLLERGVIEKGQTFHYRLRAEPSPVASVAPPGTRPGLVGTATSRPLVHRLVPLAPFQSASTEVDGGAGSLHPVVFLESALRRAERASRRGVAANPPIETGALLIGSLCSCPDTGEFFCLVEDAVEALDAEGTLTTLTFSSRTWARIQGILAARRSRPETRHQLIVGVAHGHNFKPCTPAACVKCPDLGRCAHLASSAFLSLDDVRWIKSVFPGEPWSIAHVFGLTGEGEPAEALYSGFAGWSVRRGYRTIDDAAAMEILIKHSVPTNSPAEGA